MTSRETVRTVNLLDTFARFDDAWNPRVVGDVGESQVKLARFRGAFEWHHHEREDELFFVVRGALRMGLRDPDEREVVVREGEFLIVPRGVVHRPASEGDETLVMMIEPASTLNTGTLASGEATSERTRHDLERL